MAYVSPALGRVADWEWHEGDHPRIRARPWRVSANTAGGYIARAGMGLIQIPAFDVADDLAAGTLVAVMPHHLAPPLPISLLFPATPRRLPHFTNWLEGLITSQVLGQQSLVPAPPV